MFSKLDVHSIGVQLEVSFILFSFYQDRLCLWCICFDFSLNKAVLQFAQSNMQNCIIKLDGVFLLLCCWTAISLAKIESFVPAVLGKWWVKHLPRTVLIL